MANKEIRNPNISDEEIRLECFKIASSHYPPKTGFGEWLDNYEQYLPVNITSLANQFFDYIKTGVPIEIQHKEE